LIGILDKILGFKTDDEIHAITELFKNEKKHEKRTQQQDLMDANEIKFKKIEWSAE